jgi:hypothetical protein
MDGASTLSFPDRRRGHRVFGASRPVSPCTDASGITAGTAHSPPAGASGEIDTRLAQPTGQAVGAGELAGRLNPEAILHGNEIVILLVRPSLWFIAAGSFRFCAAAVLLAVLAERLGLAGRFLHPDTLVYVTATVVLVRVMYGVMDWISHLYLLTNCRIVTIKGARKPEIFQVSLSRISEVRLLRPAIQRCFGVGTIGFATGGAIHPAGLWNWIRHPDRVRRQIEDALRKRGR